MEQRIEEILKPSIIDSNGEERTISESSRKRLAHQISQLFPQGDDEGVVKLGRNPHWSRYSKHQDIPKTFGFDGKIYANTEASRAYADGYGDGAKAQRDLTRQEIPDCESCFYKQRYTPPKLYDDDFGRITGTKRP